MQRIIKLGYEKSVTVGQYVAVIKEAKANPDRVFSRGLTGFWPVTGREIVREFRETMLTDRCNRGLVIRERSASRLEYIKARKLTSDCRWCGQSLNAYVGNDHARFCDSDCRRSYYF